MFFIAAKILLILYVLAFPITANDESYTTERNALLQELKRQGIKDKRVLKIMKDMPRHLFVPEEVRDRAYANHPLPIGYDQTISQPFIVAYMSQALDLMEGDRILEIGTGSGYQAAILAKLTGRKGAVYTIEIVDALAKRATKLFKKMKYTNVFVRSGDGYKGWKEKALFDKIILTAAPDKIPQKLLYQLEIGGQLIAPVGRVAQGQDLVIITRSDHNHFYQQKLLGVRFVPMVSETPHN